MEKRFILAVILSFAFLYGWGLLTRSAPVDPQLATSEDSNVNGLDQPSLTAQSNEIVSKLPEIQPKNTEVIENKEFTIESHDLVLTFTDLGAALTSAAIKSHDASLPVTNLNQITQFSGQRYDVSKISDDEIAFSLNTDQFKIKQNYKLNGNGYVLNVSTAITNNTKMSKLISPEIAGYEIDTSSLDINGKDMVQMRDKTLYEYALKEGKKIHRKAKAYLFNEKDNYETGSDIDWIAFRDRYFCAIIKPKFAIESVKVDPDMDKANLTEEKGFFGSKTKSNRLNVRFETAGVDLKPGETKVFESIAYIGPEEMSKLKPLGLGFEKVKRYYRFGLFDFAGKLLNQIFHLMYKAIPSWGVCIVLLSIIVYFSMYPLTKKSMSSMKKMQSVAPKINALKEKYKDNPQKLNSEMLEIYRKEKINPAGGCLPIILQMPIFLGLYQVLWRSVSIKGSNFLWINDLTQPDRLAVLPFNLPIIGNEINLLPLLMIVIMFFQQRFSVRNMVAADPIQAQQQKMMAVMMPLLIGFIFYKFSSGLTLYFTLFYLFSTFTQWKMAKEVKAEAK